MKRGKDKLEDLVRRAQEGNEPALEQLILSILSYIKKLSNRIFWVSQDAQDACQEILIKVIKGLPKYEGRSHVKIWVCRLATNFLLNAKRAEVENLTFEEGTIHLQNGLKSPAYDGPERTM